MSKITVASFSTAAGSRWSGSTAYLRIYYYGSRPEAFSFSTGEVWSPSLDTFYREVACSLASNVVTVPSVILDSTPDITNRPDVFVRMVILDSSRSEDSAIVLCERWDIPISLGASVTFEQLRIHNETPVRRFDDRTSLSRTAIEELISANNTVGGLATTTTPGFVLVSSAPVGTPKAWEFNDARVRNAIQLQGVDISEDNPTVGQFMGYNGSVWLPTSVATPSFTSTGQILIGADTDAGGTDGIVLQTRSVTRTTILNNGALDADNAYYDLNATDPTLLTWVQQNNAYPSFGEPTYPAYAMLYLRGDPATGNLFGMVTEVETGSGLKASLPAGHHGGYTAAVHGTARSTLGATTTLDVYGGNFVAEVNPGWSTGIALGCEVSVNNSIADISANFGTIQATAGMVTGISIGSGGKYIPGNGLEFFAAHSATKFRRAIVVPTESFTHRALEVGTASAAIPATLSGVVALKHIPTSNGFLVQRSNVADTGKAFALYTEAGTPVMMAALDISGYWDAAWYRSNTPFGFQVHVGGETPTSAVAYSNATGEDPASVDAIISTYSSTGTAGWRNRFQIRNQADEIIIGGAFGLAWGTGSPEGVKTATVGWLYIRTNGGASTTLYVKESGSGNTGWVAK